MIDLISLSESLRNLASSLPENDAVNNVSKAASDLVTPHPQTRQPRRVERAAARAVLTLKMRRLNRVIYG